MTSEKEDSIKTSPAKCKNPWKQDVIIGVACALFVGFIIQMANPDSSTKSKSQDAGSSYYNLLVQGFSEGHLYVKRDVPAALAQLANPYDPTANLPYLSNVGDLSYYKSHLYLYFGVTPVLVLYWPYHLLTGRYLSNASAITIFFMAGFGVVVVLMSAIRRRYFTEVNIWLLVATLLALGLTLGLTLQDTVNQIAAICGFPFVMLALTSIWCALHSSQMRRLHWILLASVAYGLAVGSHPSLLFGVIVLLVPVAQAWGEAAAPDARWRTGLLCAAAVGPVMLIGLGLMLYNYLRFDNPLEFGWNYELTGAYKQGTIQQFSPHYLWYNFRAYFFGPFDWSSHFPFLQGVRQPPHPSGYYPGESDVCGGVFTSFPLVLFALAVPQAWKNRPKAVFLLCWFVAAIFLVFATSAFTLCCFFDVNDWYRWDYLPYLILLSVIGFIGLARIIPHSSHYKFLFHGAWSLLLGYSLAFSVLSNIEAHAEADCREGKDAFFEYHFDEAAAHYHAALALWPDCVEAHCALGNILVGKGNISDGMAEYQKALDIRPDYTEADNNLGFILIRLGRVSEAIVYFKRTLEFEQSYPARARAYYNLGYAYQLDGKTADAMDSYQKALELQPQFMPALISLAWIQATWPDAALRNGSQAVALMEKANQISSGNDPKVLRTLAAAYAETGRYDDAITTAQKAIALAKQNGQTNLLKQNEVFLDFYLKHQPYHQSQAGKGN